MDGPPERCDLAVVGGGILGLALARELTRRHPARSVCVLEREDDLARHQTSHNSGVIHAGIYYEPGSLKARLCVAGARALYDYCEERGVRAERAGKLVIATEAAQLPRLHELDRRGRANGVAGLRLLAEREIAEVEPHARGVAALHSPGTGIVDFAAVARSFAGDARAAGATVHTGCELLRAAPVPRGLRLEHARGTTIAGHAVFCAGAWSDRLAAAAGADPDPRIVPFRGAYLRVAPEQRELVRAMIYPVPDPRLPFLGVHLTRGLDGELLLGPTALLAPARDAYSLATVRARDLLDTLAWPGTWRMLGRWWRTAARELRAAAWPAALAREAARFVPELARAAVTPVFAGVRAQALARDGRLLDDFALSHTERALHVRNAPSPAATASLAIAAYVAEECERRFDLRPRSGA
ncbi:MAG TPA: L-2-hydroxyglutarate oxidase [Solirubrobacteraceae bacterium]|jgi:2-hydroxyglutarate dehydrogenase|nr:L-2-hydroxyglutarate oxidase [Solirubrobacteraceae bacterium]